MLWSLYSKGERCRFETGSSEWLRVGIPAPTVATDGPGVATSRPFSSGRKLLVGDLSRFERAASNEIASEGPAPI